MKLLAIDIGNTTISVGLFSGPALRRRLRVSTDREKGAGDYRDDIERFLSVDGIESALDGVIISSVVSGLEKVLGLSVSGLSVREPLNVTRVMNTGLILDVENPEEIGADRIANAVAAKDILGDPVLVADFGTATTITAVKDGRLIGGSILTGIGVIAEALHWKTSMLPVVNVGEILAQSPSPPSLGKDTTECIVSGIIYGTAGAVERIAGEIEREAGSAFRLAITGGYSEAMAGFLRRDFRLCPDLTLQGLRILFERNV